MLPTARENSFNYSIPTRKPSGRERLSDTICAKDGAFKLSSKATVVIFFFFFCNIITSAKTFVFGPVYQLGCLNNYLEHLKWFWGCLLECLTKVIITHFSIFEWFFECFVFVLQSLIFVSAPPWRGHRQCVVSCLWCSSMNLPCLSNHWGLWSRRAF